MAAGITLLFTYGNICLSTGVIFGIFFLLRPLLVRTVTPQQRVWMWYILWYSMPFFTVWRLVSSLRVLPVTVWDLLGVVSSGSLWYRGLYGGPLFLPAAYDGPGVYALSLPGGVQVPVELSDQLCLAAAAVYLAGAAYLAFRMIRSARALRRMGRSGTPLRVRRCRREDIWGEWTSPRIWAASGLPTSFVLGGEIYLQKELPPEQQELVLLHELDHLQLRHGLIKGYMSVALVVGWWNPLIWLGYRYTCLDMELSCDARTMEQLSPAERREYAKALVELGAGRKLWDAPLAFGESDGERRVRAILAWKPLTLPRKLLGLSITVLVMLLFFGTPQPDGRSLI